MSFARLEDAFVALQYRSETCVVKNTSLAKLEDGFVALEYGSDTSVVKKPSWARLEDDPVVLSMTEFSQNLQGLVRPSFTAGGWGEGRILQAE